MEISLHFDRDVTIEDEHIFGAAMLSPSKSCDLSTWQLTINRDGILAQTIRVCQPPYKNQQTVTLCQHVSESDIQALYQIAMDVKFRHLKKWNSPADIGIASCGSASTAIKARLHNEISSVYFYDAGLLAYEGNDEAIRYLKLWHAISAHAPFVPFIDKR